MRVSEHLYIYLWNDPRENNCNTVFINGKVPTLIDPGLTHRLDDLFARMLEDKLDPLQIKLVICTHAHPDHIGAVVRLQEHAKIAMSQEEEQYIDQLGKEMLDARQLDVSKLKADFYLKEGDLVLGKHELQVIATPGHTPGGISIFWPRYKVLISGDVIFDRAIGRVDLPGGDAGAMGETIQKLSELPVELIIPGHGGAIQTAVRVKANFEDAKRMLNSPF